MRVVVAVVAVGLLAGCGSSEPRLTKAQFTERANAICSRYATYLSGLTSRDVAQMQATIAKALPVLRAGNDELRTLRPPVELQDAYDRWLDASDLQLKTIERVQEDVQKNDVADAVAALKTLAGTNLQQLKADSSALGLTACYQAAS